MKIIIFGATGMLGTCLTNVLMENNDVICTSGIDITDFQSLKGYVSEHKDIDCIINCAAFTDTTLCNSNEGMIKSFSVNCLGTKNLATICNEFGIHLIHISTDYVHSEFSTLENGEFPVNVYGCHKLLGEKYIQEVFKDKTKYSILRCSWIYGLTERKMNFVDKVLKFCEDSKDGTIKVVDDCFGRPSSVEFVSRFIEQCLNTGQYGIIDSQTFNSPISRCDFAKMIVETCGLDIEVVPVKSDYFKDIINQPKRVPETFTDESNSLHEIIKRIPHGDDYEYWLRRYLEQKGK